MSESLAARSGAASILPVALAMATQIATMLPVFLAGSLFPLYRDTLGLSAADLGMTVALFFGCSAFGSASLSGLSDRYGPWSVARASLAAASAFAALASLAGTALLFTMFIALAGIANGTVQPTTNVALTRAVPSARQGFAFGLKQASVPLATMAAGLAVPSIALVAGWRICFGLAALFSVTVVLLLPRGAERQREKSGSRGLPDWSMPVLIALGIMSGLAAGSANAMAGFYVTTLEARGIDYATAGYLLAGGSIVSVVLRIIFGWLSDLIRFPLLAAVSVLMAGGALAYAIFAATFAFPMILLATALAFGMGWGWAGLSILAIVRANPRAPGRASGVVQSALFVGAVIGPFSFGRVADVYGISSGWVMLAVATACAALIPPTLMLLRPELASPRP
ncbi:CynX/NimT family MFS transporter [Pseudooceanicola onchidii]|uniref:MFS transporter n=1 Tax=Pseudooceanicola onchidii TaxID=2562279 RepID=UPI0010AA4676|nr:MFS transporter [Pseudooceanicola onchidii]